MKVKILRGDRGKWYFNTDNIGKEFRINENDDKRFRTIGGYWIDKDDVVITELPESFCVKRCDDNNRDDWNKYLQWLNKQKNYPIPMFGGADRYKYYGVNGENLHSDYLYPVGTEIHIDDMIKHIDYMESINTKYVDANGEPFVVGAWYKLLNSSTVEYRKCCKLPNDDSLVYLECITGISVGKYFSSGAYGCTSNLYRLRRVEDSEVEKYLPKEEFDLTTNEGRLAYAKKHYPIGCIVIEVSGEKFKSKVKEIHTSVNNSIKLQFGAGLLYNNITGEWAEIIKEEINMNTQKLSRQGLKEIHSIACSHWKYVLEGYGSRNPLEDYIELYQEEVNKIFNACTKEQLPIVSKYLKQDDGSVDLLEYNINNIGFLKDGDSILEIRKGDSKYQNKSFWLNNRFDWEIRKDEYGLLCLIPTKKK